MTSIIGRLPSVGDVVAKAGTAATHVRLGVTDGIGIREEGGGNVIGIS
jgi:hypothetical protein